MRSVLAQIAIWTLLNASVIGPIPWGHSGLLCHALSLSSLSSLSLASWTSMSRRRATVPVATPADWAWGGSRGEWAQHFSNASCFRLSDFMYIRPKLHDTGMNVAVVVFAISFCVQHFTEAFDADASVVAARDQKDTNPSDSRVADSAAADRSTASDDVNCTTTDDVAAARRSLCPVHCKCSPVDSQQAWTKLTVDCSGQWRDAKKNFSFSFTHVSSHEDRYFSVPAYRKFGIKAPILLLNFVDFLSYS